MKKYLLLAGIAALTTSNVRPTDEPHAMSFEFDSKTTNEDVDMSIDKLPIHYCFTDAAVSATLTIASIINFAQLYSSGLLSKAFSGETTGSQQAVIIARLVASVLGVAGAAYLFNSKPFEKHSVKKDLAEYKESSSSKILLTYSRPGFGEVKRTIKPNTKGRRFLK